MKILIFSPYYPPHTGGLESHSDEFNKYLSQKKNVSVTVFTPQIPKNSLASEVRHNNVNVLRFPAFEIIPNFPMPKFWSLHFWKLFFSLYNSSFDITISRTRFFLTSLIALFYAKTKNTKFVHIEHGSDFVQLSSKFKSLVAKIYDYTFGWLVFKCSDLNISISKTVQKFVYRFDKRESPVIYRGLNTNDINLTTKNTSLEYKYVNKTIITFVGRLYKWKGVENSINAIKRLPQEIKDNIVFVIVGDGEDFDYLKKLSSNESSIVFTGNLPREEALGILKISDIYIHSAYPGGGLSTSLLEAMYCENSIIATPHEGANEIIENNINGILIKKSSATCIKNALISLIGASAKQTTLSQKAKETILKKINWKKSIQKYEREFNNILDKK